MYLSPSKALMDKYQLEFAPALQKDHMQRYEGRFAAFRTMLEVIEEFKL